MPTQRSKPTLNFRPCRTDAELAAYARLTSLAFGRTQTDAADWLKARKPQDIRVLTDAPRTRSTPERKPLVLHGVEMDPGVCAGLITIPMGQYFGGVPIPLTGVAAVAVGPESRGRGLAGEMMRRALREMRERETPLSGLYAATHRLYRSVGYEQAGHRYEGRLSLWRLSELVSRHSAKTSRLIVRPAVDADRPRIEAAYRHFAAANNGSMDRGEYLWNRIRGTAPDPSRAFLIEDPHAKPDARVVGWAFISQPAAPRPPLPAAAGPNKHEVFVHDMGALTPQAAERLWGFFAGFATIATDLVFFAGPAHPLLMLLPEQIYALTLRDHWMIRLVDLVRAIERRRFPLGLRASVRLNVRDDVIRANAGGWKLSVEGGRARVKRDTPSARSSVELSVGTLAAVYSGYLSPIQLAQVGQVRAPAAAIASLASIFAPAHGPPSMSEMY